MYAHSSGGKKKPSMAAAAVVNAMASRGNTLAGTNTGTTGANAKRSATLPREERHQHHA
ncbi:unnamed protein product, partial [Anisakis simplex]|uniref:Uncharacterized protein n=1 Tax=Anisakis simplex TaxID=6269 RepID=A0A0M3JNV5_ANISI